jgi:predicted RNase H-like nuclease (RuvC/YqgF family)
MAKNDLFWIAPGVVNVDGKEYGADDALPVGSIDKKILARWKKEKKVGAKIAPVAVGDKDLLDNANEKIKELEDKIDELESDVKEKAALIEKLEEDLTEATKPAGDGK